MKKLLIFLGLALACAAEPSLQAMQPSADAEPAFSYNTLKTSFYLAGGAGICEGYKRLNNCFWQNKKIENVVVDFEKKLLDQAIDDIYLALTLNSTIDAIRDEKVRNEKFCKKAQLIKLRKNVLEKLRAKESSATSGLSDKHKKALNNFLKLTEQAFARIDQLRGDEAWDASTLVGRGVNWFRSTNLGQKLVAQNPCEIGYIAPQGNVVSRMFESYKYAKVEDAIVDSILLYCKPDSELTPEDIQKKLEAEQRRATVLTALQAKISSGAKDKVTNAAIGTLMIPVILGIKKLGLMESGSINEHQKEGMILGGQIMLVMSLIAIKVVTG